MPSEVFVGKFGSNALDKIGEVHPGPLAGSLTDMSGNEKAILSIKCRDDDTGTDIYHFTWEPLFESPAWRGIPEEWYTPDNIIHSVEDGEEWIHRMTTLNRSLVKMIVRHAAAIKEPVAQD
jgi:hypothetical protein